MGIRKTNEQFLQDLKVKNPNVLPLEPYTASKNKILCRCLKDGYEWRITPGDLLHGYGCPVCANRACFTGYNDVATKRPDLIKYFVNPDDAKHVTTGSHKKVLIKCPDCGHEQMYCVDYLCHNGYSCKLCNDGVSYPNKFIRGLFLQLNIDAEFEYSPDWAQGKFYDDYFTKDKKEYVVQMDGGFHYQDNPLSKEWTLQRAQENDALKDRLALEHGITMIRIDSRVSTQEYLCNSIKNSLLGTIFDLSKVDWNECDKFATKNIVKRACEFYEQHYADMHLYEIANAVGVGRSTMWSYINKGQRFGWCTRHDPLKTLPPRRATDEFAKEVCEYYEANYKTCTKVEVARHFELSYGTFEVCFHKGLKNGWCIEHPTLTRHPGVSLEKKKEICAYYDKYYARYPKFEMAKHFNISNNCFTKIIKTGIENGWCKNHPRIATHKENRK